jgi:hypothetical protein
MKLKSSIRTTSTIFFSFLTIIFSLFLLFQSSLNSLDHNFFIYGESIIKSNNDTFINFTDNNSNSNQSNIEEINDFTLLIYMIGSDLEDKTYEATKDINEMLKSNLFDSKVNVVLETGGSTGTPDDNRTIDFSTVQRHQLENNKIINSTTIGKVNMGNSDTLANFLIWGTSTFPAKKYGLILWDHGTSVQGFGNDVNFNKDSLHLYEILTSLYKLLDPSINFKDFEFIGFDSCLMGTIEVASFLNSNYPFSKYIIASEEIEPNWGWNYTNIINSIGLNSEITGDLLGKKIIESYINDSNKISSEKQFHANRDITLSVINSTKIPELNQRLSDLVNATIYKLDNQESLLKLLRSIDITESFGETVTSSYGMIDLYDFLSNLADAFPSMKNKIDKIKDEIDSAVLYNYAGEAHPNANGLSIFLPLSLSDLGIIDRVFNQGSSVTNNINWLYFINMLGSIIKTDKFSSVVQSERYGSTIKVQVSDPDFKEIFISFVINSSKGKPILYIQNLDPKIINETGFFTYEKNSMLVLCNEHLCSPISMTMNNMKDVKKIFIPVEIQSQSGNRETSLVYEYRNNDFFFLGGIDEYQIKGGQSIPKEKVILEQGDIIIPRGLNYFDQPFFNKDPTTIKERIKNIFNSFVIDKSLTVTDPTKIKPQFVNFNQSTISIAVCDFSDLCEQTRTYYIDITNDNTNDTFKPLNQNKILLVDNTIINNSNNLIYANHRHGFQIEYPSNWFSVTLDATTNKQSQIYLNDPNILILFPHDEVLNSNGSSFSLMNSISITMQERGHINPKLYYDYFNNSETQADLESEFKYNLSNANKTSINGYPAFEFILATEKYIPLFNEKDVKRLEYWITLSMDEKEYTINFASEESKFHKYLPIVKKIVSSFKPIDKYEMQNTSNKVYDEKKDIEKIREIMARKVLNNNTIWKEYKDPNYNFTILYPYIDILNKPISQQLDNNNYLISFRPPSINFLDHPHKDPNLLISINTNSEISNKLENFTKITNLKTLKDFEDSIPSLNFKKQAFNYEYINSTIGNNLDGSLTLVYEHKYFLPLIYQWVYEKEAYTFINGKLVSISLVVPYDSYILYEPMFDNVVNSFKFLDENEFNN